jgi:hypothetical protein
LTDSKDPGLFQGGKHGQKCIVILLDEWMSEGVGLMTKKGYIIFSDDLTKKETEAIKQMDAAFKILSKRHWFFAACGTLGVMRLAADGSRALAGEGMDPQYRVADVGAGCDIDGGDY